MNRKTMSFRQHIEALLQMTGTSFHGIALKCRRCKQEALARDLTMAAGLGGWTSIRRVRGPRYSGLCIDCSKREPQKRKMP
jgi:hypothetical protein